MPTPNLAELLDALDKGSSASRASRALLLLGTVRPEPCEQLGKMPLGWIAAQLLRLRASLLGPCLICLADCRQCGTIVESQVEIDSLTAMEPDGKVSDGTPGQLQFEQSGIRIAFRLPACSDLLLLSGDLHAAATDLAHSLIESASRDGVAIAISDLPPDALASLERAVLEYDPLAYLELQLTCPSCGLCWAETLQVTDFVWSELSDFSQRLLTDVAQLAYAFGWREADILAMSDYRRRRYLELLPS